MVARTAHTIRRTAGGLGAVLLVAFAGVAAAQTNGSQGLTEPQVLAPFDPAAPGCAAPTGLTRQLVFAQDNARAFMIGVRGGLEAAARDRGLDFAVSLADNDAALQARQVDDAVAAKAGAIVAAPIDSIGLAPHLQAAIQGGTYVAAIVPPPAVTILNAPQYLTGRVLGDDAAAYIRDHLGGNAKVVLLTHDSLEFLAPRFAALRDALGAMPGVDIVADISPTPVDEQGGFDTMRTILEAHPDIDVVLGADTVVLGALKALRAAGKDRPDQYLGGIDGEPEAVAEIKSGNSPYKASIALAAPVFGYALGIRAADWLEGKSVPQAMDILPVALTADNMARYEADLADPGAVYADAARRDGYLRFYGTICFETRDRYLNFPWSSETR